jgi:hypothetical protein
MLDCFPTIIIFNLIYLKYDKTEFDKGIIVPTTTIDYINIISKIPDKNNLVPLVGRNPIRENPFRNNYKELSIMKMCSLVHIVLPINR